MAALPSFSWPPAPAARRISLACLGIVISLLFAIPLAHVAHAQELAPVVVRHWAPPPDPGAYFWGWMILTGLINSIAHVVTPKDVDAWAERQPRIAQLLAIVRRMGFEPIALIQAVFAFFAGDPPPLGHAAPVSGARRYDGSISIPVSAIRAPPPPPDAASRGFIELRVLGLLSAPVAAAFLIGCGIWGRAETPTVLLGECIAKVAATNPGQTILEYVAIAVEQCGADAVAVLDAILRTSDPIVATYKPMAKGLLGAGGDELRRFQASVNQRVGERREAAARDAGAR